MNNKNVPMETQALEIPNALSDLENSIELLESDMQTLEETLRYVCLSPKTEDPEATFPSPIRLTGLGQRIDKSATRIQNIKNQIRTVLANIQI